MQCIIHNSIRTLATDLFFLLFIQKLNEADVMTVLIQSSLFGWLHVLDQYNTRYGVHLDMFLYAMWSDAFHHDQLYTHRLDIPLSMYVMSLFVN